MFKFLTNQKGLSLTELLIAAGLTSLVIGLSVTPLFQMKQLERRVEFQGGLDVAHQVAMQAVRGGPFLRKHVGVPDANDTSATAPADIDERRKCFTGAGTNCTRFASSSAEGAHPISDSRLNLSFSQGSGYGAKSEVFVGTTCLSATTCTAVTVRVVTSKTSGGASGGLQGNSGGSTTDTWTTRPMKAEFTVPASALFGRQEVDFSLCQNKIITGINYQTLKAECVGFTGNNSCTSVAGGGPMSVFGEPNASNPANCQPGVNATCPNGMAVIGMINGQVQCASGMVCTDAASTNCVPATATPCIPDWQPVESYKCAGDMFTQIDAKGCPASAPRAATGTNPLRCASMTCTMTGSVRWPDPVAGPCGVSSAALTTNAGSSGSIVNETMGYIGTYTATCVDRQPVDASYDLPGATKSCAPIVCSGLASSIDWSNSGVKAGAASPGFDAAGPWDCGGTLGISQTTALPGGSLMTIQAEPGARATSSNTKATGTSGAVTMVCSDPGPVSAARSGVLSVNSVACVSAPAWVPPPTATPTPIPPPQGCACPGNAACNGTNVAPGVLAAGAWYTLGSPMANTWTCSICQADNSWAIVSTSVGTGCPPTAPTPVACDDNISGKGCPGRCFSFSQTALASANPGVLYCASGGWHYNPGGADLTACPLASYNGKAPGPLSNTGYGVFTGVCN